MANWFIRQARVVDPRSNYHGQVVDLLLRDGIIEDIGALKPPPDAQLIEGQSLCVSPGWMDVGAQCGDPGFEWREDIESLARAAAAGGYTAVAVLPNTQPCLHSKAEIMYVRDKAANCAVEVLPFGAVSLDAEGRDITEFIDMHHAGAVGFTDGSHAIQHSGLMRLALLYVKAFDGLILNRPFDRSLAPDGQIHESALSAALGLPGIPPLAEELMLQRDLYLADYTGSRLHISDLSTAGGVELVRRAKARGLRVTASVTAMHLCFSEEAVSEFDPLFKLSPPLRSEEDRQALIAGVLDGTIDFISSQHTPLEEEAKKRAFSEAAFGVAGIETTFAVLNTCLSFGLSANKTAEPFGLSANAEQDKAAVLVEQLAFGPRRVRGLPVPHLAKAEPANITVFDPEEEWIPAQTRPWQSKSRNNPFIGQTLKGRARGFFFPGAEVVK